MINNHGENNPMYGKKHTDEAKRKMAAARGKYTMENHPSWNGGRRVNHNGYIEIRMPEHHRARGNGYVFEHIIVAEEKIGRKISPKEHVHHKDKDRKNNHPDNLEVLDPIEHGKLNEGKKLGKYLECPICNSVFYRKKKDLRTNNFCSRSCLGLWTKQQNKGVFKRC